MSRQGRIGTARKVRTMATLNSGLTTAADQTARIIRTLSEAIREKAGDGIDVDAAMMLLAQKVCAREVTKIICKQAFRDITDDLGGFPCSSASLETLLQSGHDMQPEAAKLYDASTGTIAVNYKVIIPTIKMDIKTAGTIIQELSPHIRHTTLRELVALRSSGLLDRNKLRKLDMVFSYNHRQYTKTESLPLIGLNKQLAIRQWMLDSPPQQFGFLMRYCDW